MPVLSQITKYLESLLFIKRTRLGRTVRCTAEGSRAPEPTATGSFGRSDRNGVAFPRPLEQIGDASARPDHLCVVVRPASERDCDGAGLGPAGRKSRDGARW